MVSARAALPTLLAALAGGLVVSPIVTGCARAAGSGGPPHLPDVALTGTDGEAHRLGAMAGGSSFTVIVFFSAGCPVQRAHDARLRELFAGYRPRGVAIVAVDSEAGATLASDREEAQARAYPFPILSDPEGAVADALGATFATYAVVVDAVGRVRYRGGLDSDRSHVTPGASLWVRDALDALLAGRDPTPAETQSLGCALRRR